MQNKYKVGEVVCERIHPSQKLIISRYYNGVYYTRTLGHESRKELVFLEIEIKALATSENPRVHTWSEGLFNFQLFSIFRLWKG